MKRETRETMIVLWRDVELAVVCKNGRWRPLFRKGLVNPASPTGFDVLPNSASLPLPDGAETVSFITAFEFETGKIRGIVGNSRNDADMIAFLKHLDEKLPQGVMIELMNESGPYRLGPAVYKHLFSRLGRFSIVEKRRYDGLLRTTMRAVGRLLWSLHLDDVEAATREELIPKLFEAVKAFRI